MPEIVNSNQASSAKTAGTLTAIINSKLSNSQFAVKGGFQDKEPIMDFLERNKNHLGAITFVDERLGARIVAAGGKSSYDIHFSFVEKRQEIFSSGSISKFSRKLAGMGLNISEKDLLALQKTEIPIIKDEYGVYYENGRLSVNKVARLIPVVQDSINGKMLDLFLNIDTALLSSRANGRVLEITIVSEKKDFKGSYPDRITKKYADYKYQELISGEPCPEKMASEIQNAFARAFHKEISSFWTIQNNMRRGERPFFPNGFQKLPNRLEEFVLPQHLSRAARDSGAIEESSYFKSASMSDAIPSGSFAVDMGFAQNVVSENLQAEFGVPAKGGQPDFAHDGSNHQVWHGNVKGHLQEGPLQSGAAPTHKNKKRADARSTPIPLSALKNFRAVIFDLDGVVVQSEAAHRKTFNAVFAPFGVRIGKKTWGERYTGIGSHAVIRDVFARNGIRMGVEEGVQRRAAIYQRHIEKQGLPTTAGLRRFTSFLREHGIKSAIGSGTRRSHISATLTAIGIGSMQFVGHEDVRNHKPSPDTFLLAAKRLGVKPSECIVMEDSLAGIEAATRAGMPCISLSTTLPPAKLAGRAALVVRDFNDAKLLRAIKSLVARAPKAKDAALAPKRAKRHVLRWSAMKRKAKKARRIAFGEAPAWRVTKKKAKAPAWLVKKREASLPARKIKAGRNQKKLARLYPARKSTGVVEGKKKSTGKPQRKGKLKRIRG